MQVTIKKEEKGHTFQNFTREDFNNRTEKKKKKMIIRFDNEKVIFSKVRGSIVLEFSSIVFHANKLDQKMIHL